jgi:hypothetical protein
VNRAPKVVAALAAAAVCGSIVTVAARGTPAPAAPNPPPVGTARVERTDLASTVLTEGTLGYARNPPVVNELAGTYTALLSPGAVVLPGQVLFQVDDQPVVLMTGAIPAWRPFTPGMTDGPDVRELATSLVALGDARGLFSVPGSSYGPALQAAVRRWQVASGETPTGTIAFGAVAFAPGEVRVDTVGVLLGQPASPGASPYVVTSTTRVVDVPLSPNDPPVATGQAVSIVLPTGSTTQGTVVAIGPPAPAAGGTPSSSSSGPSPPSTVLTVAPTDPSATGAADGEAVQVTLTVERVRDVLAVPVAALLALAGGGYGLEAVESGGRHQLIGVRTGVYAGGRVQVSGPGLRPGLVVVVAG